MVKIQGKGLAEEGNLEVERERDHATEEITSEADMTLQVLDNSIDILQCFCQGEKSKRDEILKMTEH